MIEIVIFESIILSQNPILKNNQHRQKKVWVMRSGNNALHIGLEQHKAQCLSVYQTDFSN